METTREDKIVLVFTHNSIGMGVPICLNIMETTGEDEIVLATEERYLKDNTCRTNLHKLLAEYFMGTWYEKAKPLELYKRKKGSYPNNTRQVPSQPIYFGEFGGHHQCNTRKLIELPYHLTKSKQFPEFCSKIACNFDFLMAKCKNFSINEMIQDLRLAISEMDSDGYIDQKNVYEDIHAVYDSLVYGCDQVKKDPNFLATLLIAQFGPDYSGSSRIKRVISDAKQWCENTTVPLLVPAFRSFPPPGGILQGSIEVEVFLRGDSRMFKDTVAVDWEKKHLYVIHPVSRSLCDYLKVFDLSNEGNCIMTQQLKTKMLSLQFQGPNRFIHMTDINGVDQLSNSSPDNPVKLPHEPRLIVVSKTGRYLAYSTVPSTIYLCEISGSLNDIKEIHSLSGHEGKLLHIVISPDDKMLVGIFEVFSIVLEIETGQVLHKLEGGTKSEYTAQSTAVITSDNKLICRGKKRESIQVVNLKTGEQMYEVKHEGDYTYSLTFVSVHGSEKYFATGTSEKVVVNDITDKHWSIYDIETGKQVTKGRKDSLYSPNCGTENLKLFGKDYMFVAVSLVSSRKEDCFITIACAGTITDPLPEAYPYRYLQGHNDMVLQLLITPDEACMFSTAKDNMIKIWNLEKLVSEFEEECLDKDGQVDTNKLQSCHEKLLEFRITATCMKICRNSQYCFIGTSNGQLVVHNLEQDKQEFMVHLFDNEPVQHLLISSTSKFVIVAPSSGKISIWNIETRKIAHDLKFKHKISCMDEGNNILIVGSSGMEANGCIWNIESGELIAEPKLLYSFYAVAINSTGTKFVSSMFDFPVVCPVSSNSEEQMMSMEKMDSASFAASTHVAFSVDDTLASSGSVDGALRIVTDKGQYIFRLQQKSSMTCAAFSVDSQYVVTGGYRSVYVWSITDGKLKYKLRNHTDFINNIKFDKSGQYMLTTSLDKKVVLWDFRRGFSLASFSALCPLDVIDFAPNAQYIVYGPGNVGLFALLKPNPVLKKILEGNYCHEISSSLQDAQAVALSFSSQKIQQDTKNSRTCEIM